MEVRTVDPQTFVLKTEESLILLPKQVLCTVSASSPMRITWKSLGYRRRPLERNGTWSTMPWLVVMKGPLQGLVTCHAWTWEPLKMRMDASWLWILITLPACLGIMVKPHTSSLYKNTHNQGVLLKESKLLSVEPYTFNLWEQEKHLKMQKSKYMSCIRVFRFVI